MSALRLLVFLLILSVIYAIGLAALASHGYPARPEASALLWALEFQALLAIWVRIDRRRQNLSLPFEFEAFVFFAWPLAAPYYLYRTRGKQGVLVMVVVYALYIAPVVVLTVVSTIARLR